MKHVFLTILVFTAVSTYGQTSIGSDRIAGSNIVLYNLSKSDVDKIMQGTIFDIFTLDLRPNDYNSDLKKLMFLESDAAKRYHERLQDVKNRLNRQGIKTMQRQTGQTSRDTVCSISNYDVNRLGFTITLDGGSAGGPFAYTPRINGFEIPDLRFSSNSRFEYKTQILIPLGFNTPPLGAV